jgi:Flp pilus assembly protein TadG
MHKKRKAKRSGAAIVEMAVCLNILLLLVVGIFEHCRIIMVRQLMDNAAREGARQAMVSTTTMTTAQIQTIVTQKLAISPFTAPPTISVTQTDSTGADIAAVWTDTTFGNGIAVQISGNYQRMTPVAGLVLVPNPLPLRARAIAWCEAN